jgi:small subunit ribosomal protein S8
MSDPLADMLTRVRNALKERHAQVVAPYSNIKKGVLDVLQREGYIHGYVVEDKDRNKKDLIIDLKYDAMTSVIREINRVSKPGRRVYSSIGSLERFYNGLGIGVVSTSQGVLSDEEARQKNVGGEVLCKIF